MLGVSLTYRMLTLFLYPEFVWEFLLLIPCWLPFLSGEFLLHILCWLHFICGVSLTDPFFFFFFFFFCAGNLSYTSHSDFFLCDEFHFYLGSFSYTSHASFHFYQGTLCYISHPGFIFICRSFCLTDPMLPSFCLPGSSVWHIPSCLNFYVGSLSYTSQATIP